MNREMAYDNKLAETVRHALDGEVGWTERKMFGGVAFMLRGKMCCGIVNDQLMVRVGAEAYEKTLALPHVRPMDFTGKPMRGFVYVGPEGTKTVAAARKWIALGAAAPKPAKSKSSRKRH